MNKAAVFQQRHCEVMQSVRRWLLHEKKMKTIDLQVESKLLLLSYQ